MGGRWGWGMVLALVASTPAAAQVSAGDRVTLAQALATALGNSQALADAEWALRSAEARVREAWASVWPEISATASYQRHFKVQQAFLPARIFDPTAPEDQLVAVRFGADNQWQAGLSFSQPLFQATVFIGVGAADRFRSLETERLRGVAQGVVSSVRKAYFAMLLRMEDVRLTEQSVDRVRRTLEETRALHRAGFVSEYDVLRLEVQLANLEPNLRRARDGVEAARRVLAIEMGVDPATELRAVGRLHELDVVDPLANTPENAELLAYAGRGVAGEGGFGDLYRTALAERTELRQLRLSRSLEEARYAAERAEYIPKLSLFGNYTLAAQQNGGPRFFGEHPSQRTTALTGGIRVEVPLFTGFGRPARMQQARAAVRQHDARLELGEAQVAHELHTLLDALDEARQRVESQRRAVGQARRGFEIASAEYREGLGSQLQITDAEVALRQSEFNYAQAVFDYLTARASLDAALGVAPAHARALAAGGQ
jgi:outer membrane protein